MEALKGIYTPVEDKGCPLAFPPQRKAQKTDQNFRVWSVFILKIWSIYKKYSTLFQVALNYLLIFVLYVKFSDFYHNNYNKIENTFYGVLYMRVFYRIV